MNEVVFITPEDARYGFSLAGVRQLTVSAVQAEALLRQTMAERAVAVVVIDERLIKAIEAKRFNELEVAWPGLLVTLPAPEWETAGEEDYLQRLIKRALGYHVRLKL